MSHRHALILLIGIILGAAAGIACGWFFGEKMLAIKWIGDFFLDALKMLAVPLIAAAVISGVASLGDVRKLGKLGGVTVAYYLLTTGLAVLLGLILVNLFHPGAGLTPPQGVDTAHIAARNAGAADILRSLVDPNIVDAAAQSRFLPIILFSIALAAALTTLGRTGLHVIAFFNGINEAMMKLVVWLMYLAPIGIFALIAGRLGQAGGGAAFWAEIKAVGTYVLTILVGLGIHSIFLIVILKVVGRRGLSYVFGMLRALLTGFGTASSTATLPLTMQSVREQGIAERFVRFVLPLGSTVNMNGTALYEAVAAMFIAQTYGVELGLGHQAIVFITASLAAIGAAGIPEAGLVTMVIVLNAVGLPLEGVALILTVDWCLDRFRTMVNIFGDMVGAAVVQRLVPEAGGEVVAKVVPAE